MYDVVIVGGGASAVGAMKGLIGRGIKPLLLDVGFAPGPALAPEENHNLYERRKEADVFDTMIGGEFSGLYNPIHGDKRPPKLVAPALEYMLRQSAELTPLALDGFTPFVSFARGGLAAAWGCGLYRSVTRDLIGLPLNVDDLDPFFDQLTAEIGISGVEDDLLPFFGSAHDLQPPVQISTKAKRLLNKYEQKKVSMQRRGIYLGHPRLGVLSQPKDGREALRYHNMEMWQAETPALYNPYFSIAKAVAAELAEYQTGWLVTSYKSLGDHVEIEARSIGDGATRRVMARHLVLAAGTINTAKLVLASRQDHRSRLPLFDNPLYQIPLVFLQDIGAALQVNSFGMTQLNMVFDLAEQNLLLQGSIIELTSPARGALAEMFPLSARGNLALLRHLAPAAMVLFLYFPIQAAQGGSLAWDLDQLHLKGYDFPYPKKAISTVLATLRRLGAMAFAPLVQRARHGYAVHYAGPLPMQAKPEGDYQCDLSGKLATEERVYVADGCLFSRLPAKNSSFMMMANAMRIGDQIGSLGE